MYNTCITQLNGAAFPHDPTGPAACGSAIRETKVQSSGRRLPRRSFAKAGPCLPGLRCYAETNAAIVSLIDISSPICRSLLAGDNKRPQTDHTPYRLQAGSYTQKNSSENRSHPK